MQKEFRSLLVVAFLVSLAATGCLSGEVNVVIEDDVSGEVVVEVIPGGALSEALGDVDLDTLIDVATTGADGTDFETFERDGRTGYRAEVDFDGYGEILLALQGRATVAGQPIQLLRSADLRKLPDGSGWEFAAAVAPVDEILGTASEDNPLVGLADLLQAAFDPTSGTGLDLSITLPGKVSSSNADVVSGGTATWILDSPDVPPTLRMRTEPDPLVTPARLVIGGAVLAILVGLVLAAWGASRPYRVSRRARRRRYKDARFPGRAPVDARWAPAPQATAAAAPADRSVALPPLDMGGTQDSGGTADTGGTPDTASSGLGDGPPAGWYPDPGGGSGHRWWDGAVWTEHRSG